MKKLSLLAVFVLALTVFMTSCKNDSSSTTESTEMTADNASDAGVAASKNANSIKEPAVPTGPTTSIAFEETTFDFGEVMDGDKVEHVFEFTNSGSEPLIISNAKGSCGCTVPDWPKEPIKAGETGEIKVVYNSKGKGKVGGKNETKTVTITANTEPSETRIFIKGIVNKEEAAG